MKSCRVMIVGFAIIAVFIAPLLADDSEAFKRDEILMTNLRTLEFRENGVSEDAFAELTHRAGLALLKLGDAKGSVDLGIESASEQPSTLMFQTLETLSASASLHGDKEAYLKGMRWLATESGDFGKSLRFLGNLAHAEEVSGSLEKSLRVREKIVELFPGEDDTAHHLLEIARLNMQEGDPSNAEAHVNSVISGDYSEEYKNAARSMLTAIEERSRGSSPHGDLAQGNRGRTRTRIYVIAVIVLFFGLVFGCYQWRRLKFKELLSKLVLAE